eukprot:CAMPEP_0181268432 /NCGR_PEP_ID=MMETSP1097-20121128/5521_1 /TAXON_ID=35684 /ORGANISM="Pseudopedinella elastica, Strain CCMP716" /LENGTH=174 /DNA_ID=CAMNT_0023368107 /DNA_START=160 /DNA_END=684 /DNA_ORIENTATION=+
MSKTASKITSNTSAAIASETNDYLAATKTFLDTISKKSQRKKMTVMKRRRSSSDADKAEQQAPSPKLVQSEDPSDEVLEGGAWDNLGEEMKFAAKSLGRSKTAAFYRTKDKRDAARLRYVEEVASRAGRKPGQRNVFAKAHYATEAQNRSRKFEERGGRQAGHNSFVALHISVQ